MSRNRKKIIIALTISLSVVLLLAFFVNPSSAHAEKLYEVLKETNGPGKIIKNVWSQILGLINYAMIGVLIFIAFTNILRIDISRYGIKKFLPTMILAVILANFSWTICRLMVDFANVICDALINGPGTGAGVDLSSKDQPILGIAGSFNNFKSDYENFVTNAGTFDWAQVFRLFVLTAFEFAGAIAVLILAFLFMLRNYVIYFIVSIAPLAFMAMVLPQSKKFYDQWWQNFTKWTFMPIVSLFWLWVGNKWIAPLTENYTSFIAIVFAIVTYYMAITTPFKMGGALMNSYVNWSKKAGMALGGNYAKKQAQVWWSNQGNSNNVLNPLAHIARAQALGKAKMEDMDKRIASNQDAVRGRLIDRTRTGQKFVKGQDTMGGAEDLAKKELLAKHYDENPDALKGKSAYLDRMATAESRLNTALGVGKANFAQTEEGTALRAARFEYQKRLATANNDIAALELEDARDYYSNSGKWGEKGSKQWKIKNDFEASRQRKEEILEQAVNSQAKDETRVGLGEEFRVFQGNEKATKYRQIVQLEEKIAKETDTQKKKKMENARDNMVSKLKEGYEFDLSSPDGARQAEEKYIQDKANFQQFVDQRKQTLQKEIEEKYGRDSNGKLNVPYYLRPALKMSEDGKEIADINDLNSLGPKGASRLNKMLGLSIEDEAQGYDAKFSPEEMGRQLANGGDDFTKEDIENYRSGNHDKIGVDELTKIIAMQRAYLKYANRDPRSLESSQFIDKLPDVIAAGGDGELRRIADQVEQTFIQDEIASNPQLSPEAAAQLIRDDKRMSREGLDDREYITKIAKSKNGNIRKAVTLVVSQDQYMGNSRPAPESFAGIQAGQQYSPTEATTAAASAQIDNAPKIESAARQMSTALSNAATSQILGIASQFQKISEGSGSDYSGVIDQAFSIIHQKKLQFAEKFARDMGLVTDAAAMTPEQKAKLVRILGKSTSGSAEQMAEEISKEFGGVQVKIPEQRQIYSAQKIQTAIENLDKAKYADMVEQAASYIEGIANSASAKGPDGKKTLEMIAKQTDDLYSKVLSVPEGQGISPEIEAAAKTLLSKTGRLTEQIAEIVQDKTKLEVALKTASQAAEATAAGLDNEGRINMDTAHEKLYEKFTKP